MADGSNSAPPPEPIFDASWGEEPKPKKSLQPDSFGIAEDEVTRPMDEPDPRGSMFDGTVFDRNWVDTSAQDELAQKKAWMREVADTLTEPSPINRSDRQHER